MGMVRSTHDVEVDTPSSGDEGVTTRLINRSDATTVRAQHNNIAGGHHHHVQRETRDPVEAAAEALEVSEARRGALVELLYRNKFFTPPVILAIFTLVNFFTYYDRGAISPAVKYIASDRSIAGNSTLSEAESGALYSVFMVGFFAFNPVFVGLGGTLSSKTIIIVGIACWCVAVVIAGIAESYAMLMFARGMAGLGEAAYAGFTVTIVDNICPRESRTKWIGIFYSMIPTGTAAGIAVNGVISTMTFGSMEGWRAGFFIELIPMAILLVLLLMVPREYNVRPEDRGEEAAATIGAALRKYFTDRYGGDQADALMSDSMDAQAAGEADVKTMSHVPILTALKMLLCNVNFLLLSFGYAAYSFVLGAMSFFAISMLTQSDMDVSPITASLLLGATTSVIGLVASVVGGGLVDRFGGSKGWAGVYKCCVLLAACMALSAVLGFIALSMSNFIAFASIFVFTTWWLFIVTSPINCALLTVVPDNIRPYSVALAILIMHAAGDFPSPPLVGLIADTFDDGCKQLQHSQAACETHNTTTGRCKFVPPPGPKENARCVNTMELVIGLRIVWTVLVLAVPLWGAVAWRVRKHRSVTGEQMAEEPVTEDVSVRDDASALDA